MAMSSTPATDPLDFRRRPAPGALTGSLKKLDPRTLWRNPVMFSVEIASTITLATFAMSLAGSTAEPVWFTGSVSLFLWLTVFFATFAEALAEGRGKARAASLRRSRTNIMAKLLERPEFGSTSTLVEAGRLKKATASWSRRAIWSPATATSSPEPPWSTNRPSPANRRR